MCSHLSCLSKVIDKRESHLDVPCGSRHLAHLQRKGRQLFANKEGSEVTFWNMIWLELLTKFCQIGSATSGLPWMK